MSIRKDSTKGYWRSDITVGHKINAAGNTVPVRKTFYGQTKKEVQEKIDRFKENQRLGIENRHQYFGILADGWIQDFFLQDGSLKDSTKIRYIDAWNRSIKPLPLYNARMDEVTAKTIQSAYNKLIANGTPVSEIKQAHKLMRKFFRYVEVENLGRDITHSLMIPKERKNKANEDITVWTDTEIKTILNSFDEADVRFRHRFLLVLAFYTGCRKSELLALTYDDISSDGVRVTKTLADCADGLKNGKMITRLDVTDPKTGSSVRTIPIDPIVLEELQIHRNWHRKEQLKKGYRTNYIFTTDSGEFYDPKNLDRALFRYYKRIGITPKPMHTYRHTYGTNLCKNGIPIETASALMGHADIGTTARFYVNVSEDAKQAAALTLRRIISA